MKEINSGTDNLKRCPFCGELAKTYVDYDKVGGSDFIVSAYIECSKCGVRKRAKRNMNNATFMDWYALFDEAINSWNCRT